MTVDESSSQDATLIDDDLVAALGFEPVTTIETTNGHVADDEVTIEDDEVDSSSADHSGGFGSINGFGVDVVVDDVVVDDVVVDDVADDVAVDDEAEADGELEVDAAVSDTDIDHVQLDDAIDLDAGSDPAVDDPAVDEAASDEIALDDPAFDNEATDESVVVDSAVGEAEADDQLGHDLAEEEGDVDIVAANSFFDLDDVTVDDGAENLADQDVTGEVEVIDLNDLDSSALDADADADVSELDLADADTVFADTVFADAEVHDGSPVGESVIGEIDDRVDHEATENLQFGDAIDLDAPIVGDTGADPVVAEETVGASAAVAAATQATPIKRRRRLRARKSRRVIRHIDPWSVLTFSVLFHMVVFAALLLSSVLVWNAAIASGMVENVESFIQELGDYETFEINADVMFQAAIVIAGMLTLASSVLVVLLTVVFNLISDLVGGIRVTVIEEETVRVPIDKKRSDATD